MRYFSCLVCKLSYVFLLAFVFVSCVPLWTSSSSAEWLERQLIESEICLLQNQDNIIPLKDIENERVLILSTPETDFRAFKKTALRYLKADTLTLGSSDTLLRNLAYYTTVIITTSRYDSYLWSILKRYNSTKKLIFCLFGEQKSWHQSQTILSSLPCVLLSANNSPLAHELSAQALLGAFPIKGSSNGSLSPTYPEGYGIFTNKAIRLKYTIPEEVSANPHYLKMIDSLAINAILRRATPSCQVLLVKDGKVFYNKAFGYHTYDSLQKSEITDIYDVASVTKITSGLLPLMQFYEQGKIHLDSPLVNYASWLRGSGKDSFALREVLTHQARLQATVPFYTSDFKEGTLDPNYYSQDSSATYSLAVAKNIFIKPSYYAEMALPKLAKSRLMDKKSFHYSDLGFVMLPALLDSFMNEPYPNYLESQFYKPLGAWRTGFNPIYRFPINQILPTELDMAFRKQLIHGYVHDESAAVLGGYSSNAGLFSTAEDLAKILQMLLNGGEYGGKQYFQPQTVQTFTSCQFCETGNRRGLGFDKPSIQYSKSSHTAQEASAASFGHLGFTGTYIWADPKYNLIYIFLSNRIYPTRENNTLSELRVRLRIMEAAYKAIK
ncbi:MAG: beta-N-acetylglucosaminidase [Cytophagales bacterium]|nr:MAG: beta-N-acetylglucosaminidase [Cytophagales bacterium]TAF62075.1 MAG: beta-N-acetylglucosaminidase [Cytophagales bacterium]